MVYNKKKNQNFFLFLLCVSECVHVHVCLWYQGFALCYISSLLLLLKQTLSN